MNSAQARLAILGNVGYPQALLEVREAQKRANAIGLQVALLEIRRGEDIGPAFAEHPAVDALYVVQDALVGANRIRIVTLAAGAHWATIFSSRDFVHTGGLMSYGPSYQSLFRRAAEMVESYVVRSPAIFPSSSQPNLNWLSISRRPKQSVCRCLRRSSPVPTRWSNNSVPFPQRRMSAFGGKADMSAQAAAHSRPCGPPQDAASIILTPFQSPQSIADAVGGTAMNRSLAGWRRVKRSSRSQPGIIRRRGITKILPRPNHGSRYLPRAKGLASASFYGR